MIFDNTTRTVIASIDFLVIASIDFLIIASIDFLVIASIDFLVIARPKAEAISPRKINKRYKEVSWKRYFSY